MKYRLTAIPMQQRERAEALARRMADAVACADFAALDAATDELHELTAPYQSAEVAEEDWAEFAGLWRATGKELREDYILTEPWPFAGTPETPCGRVLEALWNAVDGGRGVLLLLPA